MIPEDDRQFCPTCNTLRTVLYLQYGTGLFCVVCKTTFTWSDSLRAREQHALKTVNEVASKLREGSER